jgi:predicted permease
MRWLDQIFSRRRRYGDLSESIREHLEEKIEDLMEDGMSREEATRAARREFGNVTLIEERSREVWQWPTLESLLADIKFTLHQLSKSPGFAAVSIVSLALGIGAATAIFSVIYCVIVRPFPYAGADRMIHLNMFDHSGDRGYAMLSGAQFIRLKEVNALDGAIAEDNWTMATTNEDLAQSIQADQLSANALNFFGIAPILGRRFTDSDAPLGQEPNHVVVLSYHFWNGHYSGKADVIGKILQLDHQDYTIIGVMPKRFSWSGVGGYAASDIYLPLKLSNDQNLMYPITARLKPGVSAERADAELQAMYKQFATETPGRFSSDFAVHVVTLKESSVGSTKGTLFVLFGAVATLLAIGCINVGILFLARGVLRRNEFAVRSALGAQRARLIRQLLTESLVVALTGGLSGIPVALVGTALLMRWMPKGMLPPGVQIDINLPVLLFSISIALITGVCCGLKPALEFSRPVAGQMLADSTRSVTGSAGTKRLHLFLVVSQVAFAVLLLAAALAAVRTLVGLYKAKLGYDPKNVLVMGLPLMEGSYPSWSERITYYEQIRHKLANLPEVSSVAITSQQLPPISRYASNFTILGESNQPEQTTTLEQVSKEYFPTLRIPLLQGRIWSEAETLHGSHVAVINQAMAHRYWPNGDALGKRIKVPNLTAKNTWVFDAPGNNGEAQIVGIVGDVPNAGLHEQVLPAVYAPYTLLAVDWLQFVIKTKTEPMTLVHAIREQLRSVNTSQTLTPIGTAEDRLISAGWAQERFIAALFSVLAALALLLSSIGLYSVISYTVSQSSKELGIRMALGATREHILRQVAVSVGIPVGLGLLAGVASSIFLNSVILRWTEASISNPLVLICVTIILTVVSISAASVPALRAASIDPVQALRAE